MWCTLLITRYARYSVCTTFFMLFLHRQKKYYSHSLNSKMKSSTTHQTHIPDLVQAFANVENG